MPRENSFSDEDGRSLTPDLDETLVRSVTPQYPDRRLSSSPSITAGEGGSSSSSDNNNNLFATSQEKIRPPLSTGQPAVRIYVTPKDRFRAAVRKIIQMHRASTIISRYGVGAEPGVDPRRHSAFLQYGHIREDCIIELADYSGVRTSFGRMTNKEFIELLKDPVASNPESWARVRWINVNRISWDVLSALALKYGNRIAQHASSILLNTSRNRPTSTRY